MTPTKIPRSAFLEPAPALGSAHTTFRHVAPVGTTGARNRVAGRAARRPWNYRVCAAIPHLDTPETLSTCVELLRGQSERPYILIVDTGSPPKVCEQLEAMRADDLELHFIRGHGWRHSSEPVTVALDFAHAVCRSPLLFHTHADCFLRRRDFVEELASRCSETVPVLGYRMSPRDWATTDWQWMVGHTALMLHLQTMRRIGAAWAMDRMDALGIDWQSGMGGWPDTETAFNHLLRNAGIVPEFLGAEENWKRHMDGNIDHVRSYPGSKLYSAALHRESARWMKDALREGAERAKEWRKA
jgi:hypothetical protein